MRGRLCCSAFAGCGCWYCRWTPAAPGLERAGLLRRWHRRIDRRFVGAAILEQHRAFRGVFLAQAGAGAGDRDARRAVTGVTDRANAVPDRAVIANVPVRVMVMMADMADAPPPGGRRACRRRRGRRRACRRRRRQATWPRRRWQKSGQALQGRAQHSRRRPEGWIYEHGTLLWDPLGIGEIAFTHWSAGRRKRFSAPPGTRAAPRANAVQIQQSRDKQGPGPAAGKPGCRACAVKCRCEHREVHLGKQFTLSASDSFKLGAYRADPAGTPKGGIVVIQEIFGVNQHIRKVCDDFAPGRLRRGGAGPVRPHAEGFPVRLHAAGNREGAHLRRQARLGRDDARHRSGDQRARRRPVRSASSASAWAAPSPSSARPGCRA